MTSSGEMSPAMMQIPGTWSALAGVLMGVLRSALFTSLTPRCRAPAFRAVVVGKTIRLANVLHAGGVGGGATGYGASFW